MLPFYLGGLQQLARPDRRLYGSIWGQLKHFCHMSHASKAGCPCLGGHATMDNIYPSMMLAWPKHAWTVWWTNWGQLPHHGQPYPLLLVLVGAMHAHSCIVPCLQPASYMHAGALVIVPCQ